MNSQVMKDECNPIEGIAKVVNEVEDGTAIFGNDAVACGEVPANVRKYNTIMPGTDLASVRDYLARPVLWAAGDVTASPGLLQARNFDSSTTLRAMFGTQNFDRLKGAVGLRGTLRFHVCVTRSAFNQGILAACFQYGVQSSFNYFRGNYFPQSVHLPSVRINIADETMIEFDVPYLSMREYWPIDVSFGTVAHDYGAFAFVSLTGSRVVAGQDLPKYTIYVSMHDIELIGAIPFDTTEVTLQSGLKSSTYIGATTQKHAGKPDQIHKEKEASGIVSGGLNALANVAGAISTFPGLSAIGGSADWFLRSAAGAASAFGFSRPTDETMPIRMARYAYAADSQVDIPTNAFTLSPFGSHKLAIDGSCGTTEEDHMCFDYILTKYSYIYRGEFSQSAAPGDVIYAAPVSPSTFWYRDRGLGASTPTGNIALKASNTATENAFIPSTLCYLGNNFRYWRGNLKFKISFAKTKLHGGRVQFSFVPYNQDLNLSTPLSNIVRIPLNTGGIGPVATGQTIIFDLQDASEFEFEVPYISPDPYTRYYARIGDVSMEVIQPLRTNGVAPSVVDFMVEVCAMPGFEFAGPCPSTMQGVPRTGTVAISYQSGLSLGPTSDTSSQMVIGEKFNSVKQVAMQPDFYTLDVANLAIVRVAVEPWFKVNRIPLATPTALDQIVVWFASRSGRMADMYAFVKGSTHSVIIKERGSSNLTHAYRYSAYEGGSSLSTSSFYNTGLNHLSTVYMPDTLESGRAIVPVYSRFARINQSVTTDWFGGSSTTPGLQTWNAAASIMVPVLVIRNTSGSSARVVIGRAAADDAVMSQFVGPPLVTILNSLSTAAPAYGYTTATEF